MNKISNLTGSLALLAGIYTLGVLAADKFSERDIILKKRELDKKLEKINDNRNVLKEAFFTHIHNPLPYNSDFLNSISSSDSLLELNYENLLNQYNSLDNLRYLSWLYFFFHEKDSLYLNPEGIEF